MRNLSITDRLRNLIAIHRTQTRLRLRLFSDQRLRSTLTLDSDSMRDLSITDRFRSLVAIHRTQTRLRLKRLGLDRLRRLISGQRLSSILTLNGDGMRDLSITDRLRNLIGIHRTQTRLRLGSLIGRLDGRDELITLGDLIAVDGFQIGFTLGRGIVVLGGGSDRLLVVLGGDDRRRDHSGRRRTQRHVLDHVFCTRFAVHGLSAQRQRIFPTLGRDHDVHDRGDEHERRRKRVDPDARDMRRRVTAHELDPEPAHAVARDVQREQPAMSDTEPSIDQDQRGENQQVPQQFVQERRVDDLDQLTGRHTVQRIRHTR